MILPGRFLVITPHRGHTRLHENEEIDNDKSQEFKKSDDFAMTQPLLAALDFILCFDDLAAFLSTRAASMIPAA